LEEIILINILSLFIPYFQQLPDLPDIETVKQAFGKEQQQQQQTQSHDDGGREGGDKMEEEEEIPQAAASGESVGSKNR
jgi:hypothetical protein